MARPEQEDWQAAQAEEGRSQSRRPYALFLRQVLRCRSLQAHRGDHQVRLYDFKYNTLPRRAAAATRYGFQLTKSRRCERDRNENIR